MTTNYRHLSNGLSYEIRSIEKQHPKWLQHVNLETGICSWYCVIVIFPFKEGLRIKSSLPFIPCRLSIQVFFFLQQSHLSYNIFANNLNNFVPLKGEKKTKYFKLKNIPVFDLRKLKKIQTIFETRFKFINDYYIWVLKYDFLLFI